MVTLAMRVRAGDDGQRAAWVEAQHHALVEHRRLFEEIADAAATQLAVLLRLRRATGKAVPVGKLQAFVHHMGEIAAVVGDAGLDLVRHRRGSDEIAPPDLDGIDADHARGAVEEPLDDVGRLRPSGAAIGMQRHGVGQHRPRDRVHGGDVVHAG